MSSNGYMDRSKLLGYVRRYKDVQLPDGNKVRIQDFNNAEHEELQVRTMDDQGRPNLRSAYSGFAALLIARAVVDGDGNRIFDDTECDEIQSSMEPDVVGFLRDEIVEHTKFGRSGIESQKKTSDETQGSSSRTSLPSKTKR